MQPGSIYYIVNVEAVVTDGERYLMAVRSEQEQHATGGITFAGGKVEDAGSTDNILEETARREIREEVGVEVHPQMEYLWSSAFITSDGSPVVDVIMLCRYSSGTPAALQPDEVSDVRWMSAEEIYHHPGLAPWTRRSIELAENKRSLQP